MSDFDPDAFLAGKTAEPETVKEEPKAKAEGFNPDEFLTAGKKTETVKQPTVEGPVMPQGYLPGETGMLELSKDIGQNVVKPVVQGMGSYVRNPLNILADIGMTHLGVPPLALGKNLYDTYQHAKTAVGGLNEMLSKLPADTAERATPFLNQLKDADVSKLSEAIKTHGLDKAIREFQTPEYLTAEGLQSFNALKGAMPTLGQKAMAVAGPIARGVAKVAGPAGLALNAYDAAQYAQAADLGKRLAAGQGGIAQQTFRNIQHTAGSQYQLQPQEAANVLASGDPATINLYGGSQRLQQIAGGQSPSAAPTATNFIERMRALAHNYGQIKQ